MMFIFDRTVEDVMRAIELCNRAALSPEEHAEYIAGLKGTYNYTDLNRVEHNMYIIAERLRAGGYPAPLCTPRKWQLTDYPTEGELERIRQNLIGIRAALYLPSTVPQVPGSLKLMNIVKANNIERIQYEVTKALNALTKLMTHSGTFNIGVGGHLI